MAQPNTPCSSCGKMLYTHRTSLPAERRVCLDCRRARKPQPKFRDALCENCKLPFRTAHPRPRFCSKGCRMATLPPRDWHLRPSPSQMGKGRSGRPWRRLRARVLTEETECGICLAPVDKTLPWPHPMSPSVDHIEPISYGGEPLDRDNVRLAHLTCNNKRGRAAA